MLGQRRNFVSTALKFPDQQITETNHERDHPQAPPATFPVIHRPKKDHQAQSYHQEDDAAPQIGSRPNHWRWRKESGWHFLAFFDHRADGAMQGARFQVAEEHNRGHNHDGSTKERCEDNADDWDGHQCAHILVIAVAIVVATDVSGSMVHVDVDPELAL